MLHEDMAARKIRGYLTADARELAEIRAAFQVFDADGSGTIDAKEFQNLCFEIGEVMDKSQVIAAIREIDIDRSGAIDFHEFSLWWLNSSHGELSAHGRKLRMLKMRLKFRRDWREGKEKMYLKMRAARLQGKMAAQRYRERREAKRIRLEQAQERKSGWRPCAAASVVVPPPLSRVRDQAVSRRRPGAQTSCCDERNRGMAFPGVLLDAFSLHPTGHLAGRSRSVYGRVPSRRSASWQPPNWSRSAKLLWRLRLLSSCARCWRRRSARLARRRRRRSASSRKHGAGHGSPRAREKLLAEQKAKEAAEEAGRKAAEEEQWLRLIRQAAGEERKNEEEERLARLEKENKAEYDRIRAEQAEKERLEKEEADRKRKEEQEKKRAEVAKQMEEKLAKQRAEAFARGNEAKKAAEKKAAMEREKRQKRLRRRAQGGGGGGARGARGRRGAAGGAAGRRRRK